MIKHPARYPDLADPQARPRSTGIATFFRAEHTDLLTDVDIGLIGVPFDGGITAFNGASLLFAILCPLAEARAQRG